MRAQTSVRRIGDIPAEDVGLPGLDLAGAGNDGEQRRLTDAVGSDEPDYFLGRKCQAHGVERRHSAITMGNVIEIRDRLASGHGGGLDCRLAGQTVAVSVRT